MGANQLMLVLADIADILNNLDDYDDVVEDSYSHGKWIDDYETARDNIDKLIERTLDHEQNN